MQPWLSSEAALDHPDALFQVLADVKDACLICGGLTVILYKHIELEAARLRKAKTFQGFIS